MDVTNLLDHIGDDSLWSIQVDHRDDHSDLASNNVYCIMTTAFDDTIRLRINTLHTDMFVVEEVMTTPEQDTHEDQVWMGEGLEQAEWMLVERLFSYY